MFNFKKTFFIKFLHGGQEIEHGTRNGQQEPDDGFQEQRERSGCEYNPQSVGAFNY